MRIELDGTNDFNELKLKFSKLTEDIGKVADDAVAKVAAEGRKGASRVEKDIFNFDCFTWKVHGKTKTHVGGSTWDNRLGGYKSIYATESNPLRHLNFSFEKKASKRARSKKSTYAHVSLTSRLANLFEKDTKTYLADSPYFMKGTKRGVIRKGNIRKGRQFFLGTSLSAVQTSVPIAMDKVDKQLTDRLKAMGIM